MNRMVHANGLSELAPPLPSSERVEFFSSFLREFCLLFLNPVTIFN